MSVSIIIPAYNESESLPILIDEINENLNNKLEYEIIIVNDCSIDLTENIIKKCNFKNCIYIKNAKNIGQSFSIIEGIKKSNYNSIITIDADLQNNPKDILKLYNLYISNDKLKLVGGIRNNRKDRIIKILSSKIANTIRKIILNDNCSDTGCSLKVFDKKIFLTFPEFNGIHRFLPSLYKGYNFETTFINVDHRPRIYGNSNYGILNRFFRGIRDIIKVKKIITKHKNNL